MLLFVAFPLLYTVQIGFTNYSSSNLLTQEARARGYLLEQAVVDETHGAGRTPLHRRRPMGVCGIRLLPGRKAARATHLLTPPAAGRTPNRARPVAMAAPGQRRRPGAALNAARTDRPAATCLMPLRLKLPAS